MFNENLICLIFDLLKKLSRWEIKLEMWIMINGIDYYWKEWVGDVFYYMIVYLDFVFESFNVIYRNDGLNLENYLMVYVRNYRILDK